MNIKACTHWDKTDMELPNNSQLENNTPLNVFIDESIKQIDKFLTRYIFSIVEIIFTKTIKERLDLLYKKWKDGDHSGKYHLTDITDQSFIDEIIETAVEIRPTVKIFVAYCGCDVPQEEVKRMFLKKALIFTKNNYADNTLFFVENANAYNTLIKSSSLLEKSAYTILPDLFCTITSTYLDHIISSPLNNKNDKIYNRIRNLIRLQCIWMSKTSQPIIFTRKNML